MSTNSPQHPVGPGSAFVRHATGRPRLVFVATALVVAALSAQLLRVRIDTDPENMLDEEQQARVFHNRMRQEFSISDVLVVGVINESHPDGVFNPASLQRLHTLSQKIRGIDGVVVQDLLSPSTVDNIRPAGSGAVRFEWLLKDPPKTRAEALAIRDAARRLPMLRDTLISADGRAVALYVPIKSKTESYRIAEEIKRLAGTSPRGEQVHITGLPVAEDTFGVEMFVQMAVSAPLAALVIFLLMWWFFRSAALVASPMLVAMATVLATMGLLVGLGYTVHIMSSMIPIFLMPIAVVDSVHILSEFSDRYRPGQDARAVIARVMGTLFKPMLFTSLTSAAGFASLVFTPIPPVRVFGVFVAFGILLAFALTMLLIPAYVVSLSPRRLERMARAGGPAGAADGAPIDAGASRLHRILPRIGRFAALRAKPILITAACLLAVSAYGVSRIEINDNPVRWFRANHRIRVADRALNKHFAGTYPAYLVLKRKGGELSTAQLRKPIDSLVAQARTREGVDLAPVFERIVAASEAKTTAEVLGKLLAGVEAQMDTAKEGELPVWERVAEELTAMLAQRKYFQTPQALAYVESLQQALGEVGVVGKSSSLVDLVKTVHRDLRGGASTHFRVPTTAAGVAQTLLSYQSSHRPHDLWHFVTPDYSAANLWVQLKSGDNSDMAQVVAAIDRFTAAHPPPASVSLRWAGMTYLNLVWQQEMVQGMLFSLLSAFAVVLVMMIALFRSLLFGLVSMIPLSLTIAFIYGLIGLVGKPYDMPVAVLSSLTLGLSIDFAIHFLQRTREILAERGGDWRETIAEMFQEPGRAIMRNAIVIAIGFLPLLAAPLVPYNTVGLFMAAIMAISSLATVLLLPGVLGLFRKRLLRSAPSRTSSAAASLAVVALVGVPSLSDAGDLRDANEIVRRANLAAYYAARDGRAAVRMTIQDAQGRQRRRQFVILRRDRKDGGDQDFLVYFSRPADVRKTVFLVAKHVDRDDDRWMYLPALDLVKRIAAGDKRTSFVGSDFLYEDVSGRHVRADKHKLVRATKTQYVVRNTPVRGGAVEFSTYTVWIDKKTFLPMKLEYTDRAGKVYRRIETLAVKAVDGHPTATRIKASDLRSGGFTLTEMKAIQYNIGLPESVFSERSLRSPPRRWLKKRNR